MANDFDIITIAGGTNDVNIGTLGTMADRTNTTFFGCCHLLYVGICEKYVGKRVGIISPVFTANANLPTYIAAEKQVAAYYSIPYLDIYAAGGISSNLTNLLDDLMPDGLHPNELGRLIMSRKIEAFLKSL
jgi:lysophospholipase L1-like esterase